MSLEPKFVTIRTTAKMLEISVRTVRNWIMTGKLDAIKEPSGYRWLVFLDEVNRILEAK